MKVAPIAFPRQPAIAGVNFSGRHPLQGVGLTTAPSNTVAIRVSYRSGEQQSREAANYFLESMDGLVRSIIGDLQERVHPIVPDHGPALQLRIWSREPLVQEEMDELFEWLLTLRGDIQDLLEVSERSRHLAGMAPRWLEYRLGGADLLAEISVVDRETGRVSDPEMMLGVVRGRSVMVSTPHLVFTWLEEDVFGLSVAGFGSYLLELLHGADSAGPGLRRAS